MNASNYQRIGYLVMIKSIWSTPEAEAWCRDFDYENYLIRHSKHLDCTSKPVQETTYKLLCQAFENEMCSDFKCSSTVT